MLKYHKNINIHILFQPFHILKICYKLTESQFKHKFGSRFVCKLYKLITSEITQSTRLPASYRVPLYLSTLICMKLRRVRPISITWGTILARLQEALCSLSITRVIDCWEANDDYYLSHKLQ